MDVQAARAKLSAGFPFAVVLTDDGCFRKQLKVGTMDQCKAYCRATWNWPRPYGSELHIQDRTTGRYVSFIL